MIRLSFHDNFKRPNQDYLGTVQQGEEDFALLEQLIEQTPNSSTILFDISGYQLFGYSYSKQTIRKVLLNAKSGHYGDRYFLVYTRSEAEAEELSVALRERKLTMIGSTSRSSKRYYDNMFVLGELSEPHKVTLNHIVAKKELTSGQLQKELGLESVQAASNRIKKLAEERLVRWTASPSRSRNVLDCTRIEL